MVLQGNGYGVFSPSLMELPFSSLHAVDQNHEYYSHRVVVSVAICERKIKNWWL